MRINLDSPILNFLSRAWDVVLASVLFMISCLPIVTIGAACTAMHSTIMATCNDTCTSVWAKYTGAFKADFKQSTKIWLGYLVVLVVLLLDILACVSYQGTSSFGSVMDGITVFFAVIFVLMLNYTYAVIARYIVTWQQALRNALYLITKYPMTAISVLAVNAAHLFCYWLVFPGVVLALPITPFLLFFQEALINRLINKEQGVKKEKKRKKSDYETFED